MGRTLLEGSRVRENLRVDLREVMDIRQASQYLGVAADTLYRYLAEGKIPAFKLGNRWRFKKATLDRWMELQSEKSVGKGRKRAVATRQA